MSNVTKRDLAIRVTELANNKGIELTQLEVLELIQLTIDEISDCLSRGDNVVMRNFGTFEIRETKAKIGRNPKDPEKDVVIPARSTVKFKPGKELKEKVAAILKVVREKKKTRG